jgi:hypothetical protein
VGLAPPPPSSAEVLERVELYLCSPSGPSWSIKNGETYTIYMVVEIIDVAPLNYLLKTLIINYLITVMVLVMLLIQSNLLV